MDFFEVVDKRRSVRAFLDAEVPPEVVGQILQAAIRAPTAGNRQPWHFYVVRDEATRGALAAAAYGQEFIHQAPVAIVVCADAEQSSGRYGDRGRELYCLQDTSAAIEHILLASVAMGFGGCWVGAFDEAKAAQALKLPRHHRPVAILPVGKPAREEGSKSTRQPLHNVVSYVG